MSWEWEERLRLPGLVFNLVRANRRAFAGQEEKIAYGPHPAQHLLLFQPPPGAPERQGMVFFAHGGAWAAGSPAQFRAVGRFFASHGYPSVLSGYRLVPEFRFPAQVEDIFAGYSAAVQAALARGWPAGRIVLSGQSAGAQLVALLAFDQERAARYNIDRSRFAGLMTVSGPLDFSVPGKPEALRLIHRYLGDPALLEAADPMHYLESGETLPALALHGERDPLVPSIESVNYINRLRQNGAPASGPQAAQVKIVTGQHHSDLVNLFLVDTPESRFMLDWFAAVLDG